MSVDSHYNIVFEKPPSYERLNEIRTALLKTLGLPSFFCHNDGIEGILIPCVIKGAEVEGSFFSDPGVPARSTTYW